VCLAIPGRVLEVGESGGLRSGKVRFGGIVRDVRLDFVPEAGAGDYVMVHVGFAISRVDEKEAERTYELLKAMGALKEEFGVDGEPRGENPHETPIAGRQQQ
jgi:hydrogenase expression/formation protein HypC